MKARALPHSPASSRPARRWLTLSLFDCVRVTRLSPSFSWAIPRVAVRRPSRKRFCSGLGGGGGRAPTRPGPSPGPRGEGEGGSVPAPSRRSWPRTPARPGSASVLLYASRRSSGYNVTMTFPATSRQTRTFDDRADALAHFFLRAGEAPRLLAYDDATGCPLDH